MVGEPFLPRPAGRLIVLIFVAIRGHLIQTLACAVHAIFVLGAVAARAEGVLGHGDVIGDDGMIDKSEIWVQDLPILLVDDSYRNRLVGGKGADLAPMTVFFVHRGCLPGGMSDLSTTVKIQHGS
jgi:hypothetical protein